MWRSALTLSGLCCLTLTSCASTEDGASGLVNYVPTRKFGLKLAEKLRNEVQGDLSGIKNQLESTLSARIQAEKSEISHTVNDIGTTLKWAAIMIVPIALMFFAGVVIVVVYWISSRTRNLCGHEFEKRARKIVNGPQRAAKST